VKEVEVVFPGAVGISRNIRNNSVTFLKKDNPRSIVSPIYFEDHMKN